MEDSVHVITANFSPFRLIARETDVWEPTLEQINGRTYDYVKLHRLSTFVDVGIAPFSMGACFDSTLILPATRDFADRTKALARFNQTLAELLVGGLYCEAVTPDDIGFGELTFTSYLKIRGGATGPAGRFHQSARTKHIGAIDVIALMKPEIVTVESFQTSLKNGRDLLSRLGPIPLEQLLYGTTFYVRKQWSESLIHVWTTTERIVELGWQKHIVLANGKPSKARRNYLEDHRTWTVSAKLEVLFQKGLLPRETHESLDVARKARNDFAHRGIQPDHSVATEALKSCFAMASLLISDFEDGELFAAAFSLVTKRCSPDLFPKQRKIEGASHWLAMPPLPGDKEWGDEPYELIEDLALKPIHS